MRFSSSTLSAVALSMVLAVTAFAGGRKRSLPDEMRGGGLDVSLSASGYKVYQPEVEMPDVPTPGAVIDFDFSVKGGPSIAVSAMLANRTRSTVNFSFPDPAAAGRKWTFRIADRDNNVIWTSDSNVVAPQVITEATLESGQKWRRNIRVPLIIDGAPLPVGVYLLDASIDADKQLSASTLFEVVARPGTADENTGIHVQVRSIVLVPTTALLPAGDEPLAGVPISVHQIGETNAGNEQRTVFWAGRTDENGNFSANTPPGRYRVTAGYNFSTQDEPQLNSSNPDWVPYYPPRSVEVTVVAGQFADAVIRIPVPPFPQPHVGSGKIAGQVLFGPLQPVETEGVPNEGPLAGAQITVTSLPVIEPGHHDPVPTTEGTSAIYPYPDNRNFVWRGQSDANGQFKLSAPTGRYAVTASKPTTSNAELPLAASKVITVQADETTEVTLHVDSGIR